jgi:hypothetical protein
MFASKDGGEVARKGEGGNDHNGHSPSRHQQPRKGGGADKHYGGSPHLVNLLPGPAPQLAQHELGSNAPSRAQATHNSSAGSYGPFFSGPDLHSSNPDSSRRDNNDALSESGQFSDTGMSATFRTQHSKDGAESGRQDSKRSKRREPEEAINTPFCLLQEKSHTFVLRGLRNSSETPVKSPYEFAPANLYLAYLSPPDASRSA